MIDLNAVSDPYGATRLENRTDKRGNRMKEKLIKLLTGMSLDTPADVEYVAEWLIENNVTICHVFCDLKENK